MSAKGGRTYFTLALLTDAAAVGVEGAARADIILVTGLARMTGPCGFGPCGFGAIDRTVA